MSLLYFLRNTDDSLSKEEWIALDNASIAKQDKRGRIIAAEKKGRLKTRKEVKKAVIRRAKKLNLSFELIALIVDLPINEVLCKVKFEL